MKWLAIALALGWLAGCSTPHAVRVRCDAHLVPINSSGTRAGEPVARGGDAGGATGSTVNAGIAPGHRAALASTARSAGGLAP